MNKIQIEKELNKLEFELVFGDLYGSARYEAEQKLFLHHQQLALLDHNVTFIELIIIEKVINSATNQQTPYFSHFNLN